MEEQILRSIRSCIPDLVQLTLKKRPNADKGSVEVAAAIVILIATIHILNSIPISSFNIEALIDALVVRLPRNLEDRNVILSEAVLDAYTLSQTKKMIYGANNTNLLGAFTAIYNSRILHDLERMGSMKKGPLGEMGGVIVVTSEVLLGKDSNAPINELMEIYMKHLQNINEAIRSSSKSSPSMGNTSCFIATACFESGNHKTVKTLRLYREVVLKKSFLGRKMVLWYYRFSPPVARFIELSPTVKKILSYVLSKISNHIARKLLLPYVLSQGLLRAGHLAPYFYAYHLDQHI